MTNKIIIATRNEGKASEFKDMFNERGYEIQTLLDYPDVPDVEETGETFEENALLKSETIANHFNTVVLSDDSGLMVKALNGEPGVYSARYSGKDKDDQKNNEKLLAELEKLGDDVDRSAKFHTTLALSYPGVESLTVTGEVHGEILNRPRGENGFGYDPLFYVSELSKGMAELKPEEKNKISHRAEAIKELDKVFDNWIKKIN